MQNLRIAIRAFSLDTDTAEELLKNFPMLSSQKRTELVLKAYSTLDSKNEKYVNAFASLAVKQGIDIACENYACIKIFAYASSSLLSQALNLVEDWTPLQNIFLIIYFEYLFSNESNARKNREESLSYMIRSKKLKEEFLESIFNTEDTYSLVLFKIMIEAYPNLKVTNKQACLYLINFAFGADNKLIYDYLLSNGYFEEHGPEYLHNWILASKNDNSAVIKLLQIPALNPCKEVTGFSFMSMLLHEMLFSNNSNKLQTNREILEEALGNKHVKEKEWSLKVWNAVGSTTADYGQKNIILWSIPHLDRIPLWRRIFERGEKGQDAALRLQAVTERLFTKIWFGRVDCGLEYVKEILFQRYLLLCGTELLQDVRYVILLKIIEPEHTNVAYDSGYGPGSIAFRKKKYYCPNW
jgi:hypothetical protein